MPFLKSCTRPRIREIGVSIFEQRVRGERAERDDDARTDRVDLREEERLARGDFVRLGLAVAGRAALDHVRDVDVARA